MKAYLKNPLFYYIAICMFAGLWAVTAAAVFYPRALATWQKEKQDYEAAEELLAQIIKIEPQRLTYQQKDGQTTGDFDFSRAVNEFAVLFSISPANFTLNTRGETRRAGKRARSATLSIRTIDIERTAKFLSAMLVRWPELQCEQLTFEKLPQGKDNWRVDMTLTYYY
jgi:hypothetical protein